MLQLLPALWLLLYVSEGLLAAVLGKFKVSVNPGKTQFIRIFFSPYLSEKSFVNDETATRYTLDVGKVKLGSNAEKVVIFTIEPPPVYHQGGYKFCHANYGF